jgi:hypothetical protein
VTNVGNPDDTIVFNLYRGTLDFFKTLRWNNIGNNAELDDAFVMHMKVGPFCMFIKECVVTLREGECFMILFDVMMNRNYVVGDFLQTYNTSINIMPVICTPL